MRENWECWQKQLGREGEETKCMREQGFERNLMAET